MLDWPDNNGKFTSHKLKVSISKSTWNVVRGFIFQFGVI